MIGPRKMPLFSEESRRIKRSRRPPSSRKTLGRKISSPTQRGDTCPTTGERPSRSAEGFLFFAGRSLERGEAEKGASGKKKGGCSVFLLKRKNFFAGGEDRRGNPRGKGVVPLKKGVYLGKFRSSLCLEGKVYTGGGDAFPKFLLQNARKVLLLVVAEQERESELAHLLLRRRKST